MRFPKGKYTDEQKEWCRRYERETGFDPHAMADYEQGNLTFVQAAKDSIAWFENWMNDAYLRITKGSIPGNSFEDMLKDSTSIESEAGG